MYLQGVPQKIL